MSFYVDTHYKYFTHAPFLEDRWNNDLPKRKLEFRPRFSFKVSWFLSIADPLRCSSDLLPKPLTPITDVVINLPLFLLCGRDAKFGFSSDPDMHPIRRWRCSPFSFVLNTFSSDFDLKQGKHRSIKSAITLFFWLNMMKL